MMARKPKGFGSLDDQSIEKIYAILAKKIVPKSDLTYDTPFELLVAVVLSAQATDKSRRRSWPWALMDSPPIFATLDYIAIKPKTSSNYAVY